MNSLAKDRNDTFLTIATWLCTAAWCIGNGNDQGPETDTFLTTVLSQKGGRVKQLQVPGRDN